MKQWELRRVTVDVREQQVTPRVVPGARNPIRALVDQFPGAFWTTDSELRFTSLLGRGLAEIGLGPNQVVGMTVSEFFETDDARHGPLAAHNRALAGDTAGFVMRVGRQPLHCQVAPLHDALGQRIGTIGVAVGAEHTPQRKRVTLEPLLAAS